MTAVRVLPVDDELPGLNALERMLRGPLYEVLVAHTAREALLVLSKAEGAVIVCDYGLDSVTGAEVPAEAAKVCPPYRTNHADRFQRPQDGEKCDRPGTDQSYSA